MIASVPVLSVALTLAVPAAGSVEFEKRILSSQFEAEACAWADINGDGQPDIVAGENYYLAPDFKPCRFRELVHNADFVDVRLDCPEDVNGDGRVDLITVRRGAKMQWLENPGGACGTLWKGHDIGDCPLAEAALCVDVDGDGRRDLICPTGFNGDQLIWWKSPGDPKDAWAQRPIGKHNAEVHGMGLGDVNRDGRLDVLSQLGWHEKPAQAGAEPWALHPLDRGFTHHPVVYDIDGDGDQDVAASSPHDYGMFWFEQKTDDKGGVTWHRHEIDKTISQMHCLVGADLDGDGDLDLLSGKRYHAGPADVGSEDPAMLVWYELVRGNGEVKFVRHDIDDASGVGLSVRPLDFDGDGDLDILTSNKKGLNLFVRKGKPDSRPLFNGKDLSNWTGDMSLWSVKGDTIVGKTETGIKQNAFLVSREKYDDFVLTVDVKLTPDSGNSGIQFRSTPRADGEVEGYQADIGQDWWGSIYEEQGRGALSNSYQDRGRKAVIPGGWNSYVVYAVGDELRVEINGTICTAIRDAHRKTGIIALQVHSGGPMEVCFRNLRLLKMP